MTRSSSGQTAVNTASTPQPNEMVDSMIDVRRVEKRVNHASIKRFNEILERHPEAVGQALRRWLNDGQR